MKPMTKNVVRLLVTIALCVLCFIGGTVAGKDKEREDTIQAIQFLCLNEEVIFTIPKKGEIHTFTCIYSGPKKQTPSRHLPNRT